MSFGNAKAERRALELTYEDTASIIRMTDTSVGAIDKMAPTAVYEGVRCGLSRTSDRSKQTAAQQDIEYDAVLFLAPELSVEAGDTAEVTRFGSVLNFEVVGIPTRYATHQEVFLKARDLA